MLGLREQYLISRTFSHTDDMNLELCQLVSVSYLTVLVHSLRPVPRAHHGPEDSQ